MVAAADAAHKIGGELQRLYSDVTPSRMHVLSVEQGGVEIVRSTDSREAS